jgi:hypothetical protein
VLKDVLKDVLTMCSTCAHHVLKDVLNMCSTCAQRCA